MKICPSCHKMYEDDSLNYCLDDGAPLDRRDSGADISSEPTVVIHPADSTRTGRPLAATQVAGPVGTYNVQPKARSRSWLWVVGILVVLITVCGGGSLGLSALYFGYSSSSSHTTIEDPPPTRPTPRATSTPLTTFSSGGEYDVSMEKYNKIKIGMARSEVESILGGKGNEISSSTGGGMSFSVNQWEGDDFKSIILSFKDEKVMSKSQVGLK
ncbi:MAG: hypothetical protein ABJB40_12825 [Acidobacteriota bacterium]